MTRTGADGQLRVWNADLADAVAEAPNTSYILSYVRYVEPFPYGTPHKDRIGEAVARVSEGCCYGCGSRLHAHSYSYQGWGRRCYGLDSQGNPMHGDVPLDCMPSRCDAAYYQRTVRGVLLMAQHGLEWATLATADPRAIERIGGGWDPFKELGLL